MHKKQHILFLSGVFLSQCPDDDKVLQELSVDPLKSNEGSHKSNRGDSSLDDSSLEDSISDADEDVPDLFHETAPQPCETEYDQLPTHFISLESWPKSVNLLCWSCDNQVHDIPWFVPIGRIKKLISELDARGDRSREVLALVVHGCFCSPFCVKRYINRIKDDKIANKQEVNQLLKVLYYEITGKEAQEIPESDDKTIQMQFSGPKGISVQEYRDRNANKRVILRTETIRWTEKI